MTDLKNVDLNPIANVYFDGKCVSHSFVTASGEKKSAGVILPAQLVFNTAAAEIMQCVAGSCEYRLAGQDEWQKCGEGKSFEIPANSSFDIKIAEVFHYICHYK